MKANTKSNVQKKMPLIALIAASAIISMYSCSGGQSKDTSDNTATTNSATTNATTFDTLADKGIGPITSVTLGAINEDSAAKGKTLFATKCSACHKLDTRLVGPPLRNVTSKASPEWIMNQILNPEEQDKKDPVGQALLAKYMTQMTFQDVSKAQARDILEYLRSVNTDKK